MSIVLDGTNGITSPEINSASGNLILPSDLSLNAVSTEARAIEVGGGRTGDGASYVDLIGDATYTDFGARFSRSGGANATTEIAHRGSGDLRLSALEDGAISVLTSSAERMRIDSLGRMTVSNQPHCFVTQNGGSRTIGVASYGVANGTFLHQNGGFYLGGLINGFNVVHVPITGWYRVDHMVYLTSGINSDGGRLYVKRNDSEELLFTQNFVNGDGTTFSSKVVLLYAGDYLNYVGYGRDYQYYFANNHTMLGIHLVS